MKMLKTEEENKPAKFCGGSHLVVHKTKQATAVFDFTKTVVLCNWGASCAPLLHHLQLVTHLLSLLLVTPNLCPNNVMFFAAILLQYI